MKFFSLLVLLLQTIIWPLSDASVPINQMTVNQIYCEKDLPLFDCAGRAQRKNKTAQMVTGYFLFKQDYGNDISTTFRISTQDHAIWKQLVQKNMNETCELYFNAEGKGADQRKRFFPTIPDGCPVKAGNFITFSLRLKHDILQFPIQVITPLDRLSLIVTAKIGKRTWSFSSHQCCRKQTTGSWSMNFSETMMKRRLSVR